MNKFAELPNWFYQQIMNKEQLIRELYCKYDALHIMTVVRQALKLISLLDRLADTNHIGTMLQKAKAEQST